MGEKLFYRLLPGEKSPEKVPRREQEEPGNQRKIVGGVKSSGREAQRSQKNTLIKGLWQDKEGELLKAQIPSGDTAGQKKEQGGEKKP